MQDRVEIIPNDMGSRTTPSWVAFTESEMLVGDAAKNQGALNPKNTVFDAKRLIGRKYVLSKPSFCSFFVQVQRSHCSERHEALAVHCDSW